MPENIIDVIIDEVALEGLDGITLNALWFRLSQRLSETLPFKENFKEQIWSICVKVKGFSFFKLKTPREALNILDLDEYMSKSQEIYPNYPIEVKDSNIKGSCSNYHSREDITNIVRHKSLTEVNNDYGQLIIIVASQSLREEAIFGDKKNLSQTISLLQYCLLERIGRARFIGEMAMIKNNGQEDPKSLFYQRKTLLAENLIKKQMFSDKRSFGDILLHLPRFYQKFKPKSVLWTEKIINYLKMKPNYAAGYDEIKNELGIHFEMKKILRNPSLQNIFNTDIKIPFKKYYGGEGKNSPVKSNLKNKPVKLISLINPEITVADFWLNEDCDEVEKSKCMNNHLDIKNHYLNIPFLKQVTNIIETRGETGISQTELGLVMGFPKLITRTFLRNLVKLDVVRTYLLDSGRQRTTMYVFKHFQSNNSNLKKIELEMLKMKEYQKSMEIDASNKESEFQDDIEYVHKFKSNSSATLLEENDNYRKNVETEISANLKYEASNTFKVVNAIFKKYKLSKCYKYQYTSRGNKNLQEDETQKQTKEISEEKKKAIINSSLYKNIEVSITMEDDAVRSKKVVEELDGFMKDVEESNINNKCSLSYRSLHRANLILQIIKDCKIIDDTTKLVKLISIEEQKEGYQNKIDKVSLSRLLLKLSKDNFIKIISLNLKSNDKIKTITLICDPNITLEDGDIQLIIEQAKMKFCMNEIILKPSRNEDFGKFEKKLQIAELNYLKNTLDPNTPTQIARDYGYCPKFERMRHLHIFIFYLVYEHSQQNPLSEKTILEMFNTKDLEVTKILEKDIQFYQPEISWKMFIPPLPRYQEWPRGWVLMSDLIYRMPLSIFMKINNIKIEIKGLKEYLNHPIKQHFLLKDLPVEIRSALCFKRKYVFSVHENITRLGYLGLIQFGPQVLKEKDQVYIYINTQTELMDTTSSASGYHKIEEKLYPIINFYFSCLSVVENYWYEMWNICINTCLGERSAVEGKDIILEDLGRKVEMIQATKPKDIANALRDDNGLVPGDRKGAAGIDSAFFAHLKRNWTWTNQNLQRIKQFKKMQDKNTVQKFVKTHNKRTSMKEISNKKSPKVKLVTKEQTMAQPKPKLNIKKSLNEIIKRGSSKPATYVRKVLPRKQTIRKRVKYDERDHYALQKMDKLRVDWAPHEDNILLVCKVAMLYLCPNPRRNFVTFTSIRDILQTFSYSSSNKTTRACQRRLLYMLKKPKTVKSILLGVEELKQDYIVTKRFEGIIDQIRAKFKNPEECDRQITTIFKELVCYVAKKYNLSNIERKQTVGFPQTIQEFNIFYKLKFPSKTITKWSFTKDIQDINDIHTSTITSIIHSSMCCGKDRTSWAYQLFRVYQQYPEYLLRNALLKIRSERMVIMKKNYMCALKKFGNCMPMSSSQYQLSSAYYYKFQTKWPYEIFSETCDILIDLFKHYINTKDCSNNSENNERGCQVKSNVGGIVATVLNYISEECIKIDVEIPDQIIMLDPSLQDKDEVYTRIARRYQDILQSLNNDINLQITTSQQMSPTNSNFHNSLSQAVQPNNNSEENILDSSNDLANENGKRRASCDLEVNTKKRSRVEQPVDGNIENELEETVELLDSPSEHNHFNNLENLNHIEKSNNPIKQELPRNHVHSATTDVGWKNDVNDQKNRQTRIAMLKMREELQDLTFNDSHHAHEFFVVNPFKLFYSLRHDNFIHCKNIINFKGLELPEDILPIKLSEIEIIIDKLKKFAILPKDFPSYEMLRNQFDQNSHIKWQQIESVCKFIIGSQEYGVTLERLVDEYVHLLDCLDSILNVLIDARIILRTGVVTVRFVHHQFADPWVINSCKILRLEKESHPTVPEGTVYVLNDDEDNDIRKGLNRVNKLFYSESKNNENNEDVLMKDIKKKSDELIKDIKKNSGELIKNMEENSDMPEDVLDNQVQCISTAIENLKQDQKRLQKNRTKEITKSAKQLDLNTTEEIKVVIKPWIRIDGALNRRVLDRMLGAVLCYCIEQPFVSLSKVQNRFLPALQPFHTRELVEILCKLGCVIMTVQKQNHVTLFSKPRLLDCSGSPNLTSNSDLIILNTTIQATIKFGIFLSNKLYSQDFLQQ